MINISHIIHLLSWLAREFECRSIKFIVKSTVACQNSRQNAV